MCQFSIIIPIHVTDNNQSIVSEYIEPCLKSVVEQTDLNNTEIILVLNKYNTQCLDVCNYYVQNFGFKACLNKNGLGFPKAVNTGIKLAEGDFIILLNDDCVLLPIVSKNNWIEKLYIPFVGNEKMGITGVHKLKCHVSHINFVVGYCIMLRKKMLDQIGIMDEIFGIGTGEDIDLCGRAQKNGWLIKEVGSVNRLDDKYHYGSFPIFHAAEKTFDFIPEHKNSRIKNFEILHQRYIDGYYSSLL